MVKNFSFFFSLLHLLFVSIFLPSHKSNSNQRPKEKKGWINALYSPLSLWWDSTYSSIKRFPLILAVGPKLSHIHPNTASKTFSKKKYLQGGKYSELTHFLWFIIMFGSSFLLERVQLSIPHWLILTVLWITSEENMIQKAISTVLCRHVWWQR